MNEFITRISSYDVFNFLLPGIVFAVFVEEFTSYSIVQENILLGLFLYYFLGVVISRFGSVIISPILRLCRIVKFKPYKDFQKSSKKNPKLEKLSMYNNMYRTFISVFSLVLILMIWERVNLNIDISESLLLVGLLLVLFILSYRKQTNFITKNIK